MITSIGRFRILEQNELVAPGNCMVCGTGSGKFIDFGFTLDYFGAVYMCFENCFREACNAFNYFSPKQYRLAADEVVRLRAENNSLKDQVEGLTDAIRNISSNFAASITAGTTSNGPDLLDEKFEPSEQTTGEYNSEDGETKSESDGSVNEPRSTDVQHDDSLDDFIKQLDI